MRLVVNVVGCKGCLVQKVSGVKGCWCKGCVVYKVSGVKDKAVWCKRFQV